MSTRFQTISLLKADEWAYLPPWNDHRQTLFTFCRQCQKIKDWSNTQLDLSPHVLPMTPHPVNSLSSPWDKPISIPTFITPVNKIMSPSQQRDLLLQTLASTPTADVHVFKDGSVQDGIEDSGVGLVVLSHDDLIYAWHASAGSHSSSMQAEKAALKEAIQWPSSISS